MSYSLVEQETRAYVNELFFLNTGRQLPFHNAERTADILKNIKKIVQRSIPGERDMFIIKVSAWFCDTGFLLEPNNNPEAKSEEIAAGFLEGKVAAEDIDEVRNCIKAAHGDTVIVSSAAKVVSDACTMYLASGDFKIYNKQRRKEYELLHPEHAIAEDWNAQTIELLRSHRFYTDYCITAYEDEKQSNLRKLLNKQQQHTTEPAEAEVKEQPALPEKKKGSKKEHKPEQAKALVRGVEVMFRMSSTNNIRMSVMADNKAHIMITVNSIIISVVFGLIVRNMDKHQELLVPAIMLLFVNVLTIIYSVLATRPAVSPGVFTQEQVENKSVNMLFYGSFYNMGFDEYQDVMKKVMTDSEFLYACLIKDLYWQGKVLGRKYRLLRKSYTIFLYGIIASVAAFVIAGVFLY